MLKARSFFRIELALELNILSYFFSNVPSSILTCLNKLRDANIAINLYQDRNSVSYEIFSLFFFLLPVLGHLSFPWFHKLFSLVDDIHTFLYLPSPFTFPYMFTAPSTPHGLPWWLRWWRICLQCRRPGFDPWVGKIPWRREWQPTPVFLPE